MEHVSVLLNEAIEMLDVKKMVFMSIARWDAAVTAARS